MCCKNALNWHANTDNPEKVNHGFCSIIKYNILCIIFGECINNNWFNYQVSKARCLDLAAVRPAGPVRHQIHTKLTLQDNTYKFREGNYGEYNHSESDSSMVLIVIYLKSKSHCIYQQSVAKLEISSDFSRCTTNQK